MLFLLNFSVSLQRVKCRLKKCCWKAENMPAFWSPFFMDMVFMAGVPKLWQDWWWCFSPYWALFKCQMKLVVDQQGAWVNYWLLLKHWDLLGSPQRHQYVVMAYSIVFPLCIPLSLTSCLSLLKSITDCVDVCKSVYTHMRKTPRVDADGIFFRLSVQKKVN